MSAPFHTPSFGDEVVYDLTDDGSAAATVSSTTSEILDYGGAANSYYDSKRMRGGIECSSVDEYTKTASEESTVSTSSLINTLTAAPPATATTIQTAAARKQMSTPMEAATIDTNNEPKKPLSAYALFFRETVLTIKQENPQCPFQDISLIVTSMWETLDDSQRSIYQKRADDEREEYSKQMLEYTRQCDLEQQRQQEMEQQQQQQQQFQHYDIINQFQKNALQTKPAVFTIARPNSMDEMSSDLYNQMIDQPEASGASIATTSSAVPITTTTIAAVQSPQSGTTPPYLQQQQQQQQQQASTALETQKSEINTNGSEQMRMLSEAGSVPKCTRDGCNKLAIINPDWEDEYCSNECVVEHCKTVFNNWVLENKADPTPPAQ